MSLAYAILFSVIIPPPGIGMASIIMVNWYSINHVVILAWNIFYLGLSFSKTLPWSHCDNDFNTEYCINSTFEGLSIQSILNTTCSPYEYSSKTADSYDYRGKVCFNGKIVDQDDLNTPLEELW